MFFVQYKTVATWLSKDQEGDDFLMETDDNGLQTSCCDKNNQLQEKKGVKKI